MVGKRKRSGIVCEECGLKYENFKTGLEYKDVYVQFWSNSDDYRDWHPKRRHTVLGRWHEIKMMLWKEHIEHCGKICFDEKEDRKFNEY